MFLNLLYHKNTLHFHKFPIFLGDSLAIADSGHRVKFEEEQSIESTILMRFQCLNKHKIHDLFI